MVRRNRSKVFSGSIQKKIGGLGKFGFLSLDQFPNPFFGQAQKFIELGAGVGCFLSRGLHFHKFSGTSDHDIGIDGSIAVLRVVQIEHAFILVNSHTDGCQMVAYGVFL